MPRVRLRRCALWSLLLLTAFLWSSTSAIFALHTHVDAFGRVVIHTHPIGSSPDGDKSHGHTDQQYLTLSAFVVEFFAFLVVAIFVAYLLAAAPRLFLRSIPLSARSRQGFSRISIRAPPVLLIPSR